VAKTRLPQCGQGIVFGDAIATPFLVMVDTNTRIAYPLTKHKVRGISDEKKNTEGVGEFNGYYS